MKKWIGQLMSFEIDDENLTMQISLNDLKYLFDNYSGNFNGYGQFASIKEGKEADFASKIVEILRDEAPYEADDLVWSQPFSYAFNEIIESAADDILDYTDQ